MSADLVMPDAADTPEEIAMAVMQSEEMMWLMVGANHVESHLNGLRQAWQAYIAAGGLTYGKTI